MGRVINCICGKPMFDDMHACIDCQKALEDNLIGKEGISPEALGTIISHVKEISEIEDRMRLINDLTKEDRLALVESYLKTIHPYDFQYYQSQRKAKKIKNPKIDKIVWAVTDCGHLTTGATYYSPEKPFLLFERKEDAEVRQNLIIGKLFKVRIISA